MIKSHLIADYLIGGTAQVMIPEHKNSYIKLYNVFEMSEEELLNQHLIKISD